MEQVYTPKQNYKVLVNCMTYNQSKYIEDALNGFAMQKTDFPFACLVMDDASTDGEQEIIKTWMERECDMEKAEYVDIELSNIILVPHIHNANCTFALYFLKRNLRKEQELKDSLFAPWRERCVYEALCEGDDYWIHPGKLQMQVNVMDFNNNIAFSHTGFDLLQQKSGVIIDGSVITEQNIKKKSMQSNLIEAILEGGYRVQTMTVLIRMVSLFKAKETLKPYSGKFLMGDTQLWIALSTIGEVYFHSERTSVYRVNVGSACRPSDFKKKLRFDLSCAEMRVVMADAFNQSDALKNKLHKAYHNKLNLYLCYDSKYIPFVDLKFSSLCDYMQFNILKARMVRPALKWIYQRRYSNLDKLNGTE